MIKLTLGNGHIYVPENIVVTSISGNTSVMVPGHSGLWTVTESPEEVTRKILDYKLAMVRYGASCNTTYYHGASVEAGDPYAPIINIQEDLKRFAGLEDKADE